MNISATALLEARQRDGEPAEDRSDRVEASLTYDKRVGYRDGLPLVEPSDGLEQSEKRLGEDVSSLYEHYVRGDSLLLPTAGDFLRRLFKADEIESVEDAADELNTDTSTVSKAVSLHGIDVDVADTSDDDEKTIEELTLPSGERIPLALLAEEPHTDKLLLAQLLSVGMGVEEIALYLSKELDENVTPSDVRRAAEDARLLSGEGTADSETLFRGRERTVTAGQGEPASTPWD